MRYLATFLILLLVVECHAPGATGTGKITLTGKATIPLSFAPGPFFIVTNVTGSSTTQRTIHQLDNVVSGDLIVLTTQNELDVNPAPTVTDSVGGTYASASSSLAHSTLGNAAIYTNVTTGSGTIYVTNNWGANKQSGVVYLVRGQATATAATVYSTNATSTTTLNWAIPITTAASMIFYVISDFNSDDTAYTYRTAPAYIPQDFNSGTSTRGIHGYSTNLSATTQTGWSNPGGALGIGSCGIVVRPP